MPTLAEIRAKYPQYNDMDDTAFVDAFHKKFYSDMPRQELDKKLGIEPEPFVGPDQYYDATVLPLRTNKRTGEREWAVPGMLKGVVDMATGWDKMEPQTLDQETGEVHTNPQLIGGAMETAMAANPAAVGRQAIPTVAKAMPKLPARAPAAPKPAVVPKEAWAAEKTKAYKAVDDLGAKYSQSGFDRLVDNINTRMVGDKFNPRRHPKAASMLDELTGAKGSTPSLTELDQWRQVIRRDVKGDEAEGHFGELMIDEIDDFLNNATARDMVAGDPKAANQAILAARTANSKFRKTEVLEDALKAAKLQAGSAGSGGNIDNAIRQQVKAILKSPRKARFFSKAEREAMEKVVNGTDWQNRARLVGKLSPEGNGLSLMLHLLGSGFSGGMTIPGAVAGYAAKRYADKATKENLDDVLRLIQQ